MQNLRGAFRCISKYLLLCQVVALSISSTAYAGTIFVSGDATPAFYAADSDNDVFFANILQSGSSVFVHDLYGSSIGNNLNSYYNTLTGGSATYSGDTVLTSSTFSGLDLFVTGLTSGGLAASELSALASFSNSGGSVLFMGDYTAPETYINNALAYLGSSMSLYTPFNAPGTRSATGSSIATDPFTAGVSSFTYGYGYGVSGGTSLFLDETGRTFVAYNQANPAPVPEPGTLLLLSSGLAGLALYRKKAGSYIG